MSSAPHDANSMDQVRELLFGAQIKEIETHLRSQEDRITGQIEALREEVRASLQKLETNISGRLADEAREREQVRESCAKSLDKLKEEVESRAASLYAALNKSESALQALITSENARITAAVEERYKFALDSLSENTARIREDMVDKNIMAALLNGLAEQLAPAAKSGATEKKG